jgi:hypothetical protein
MDLRELPFGQVDFRLNTWLVACFFFVVTKILSSFLQGRKIETFLSLSDFHLNLENPFHDYSVALDHSSPTSGGRNNAYYLMKL